jgi:hypothetical protein
LELSGCRAGPGPGPSPSYDIETTTSSHYFHSPTSSYLDEYLYSTPTVFHENSCPCADHQQPHDYQHNLHFVKAVCCGLNFVEPELERWPYK